MTITYYSTDSPYNMVTKKLVYKGGTTVAYQKDTVDILKPKIILQFEDIFPNGVNYMYIEDFKRYYFCKPQVLTGGRIVLDGEVDVLMTYDSNIRAININVKKQRNMKNLYLPQSQPILSYRKNITKQFTTPFYETEMTYILGVLGGQGVSN